MALTYSELNPEQRAELCRFSWGAAGEIGVESSTATAIFHRLARRFRWLTLALVLDALADMETRGAVRRISGAGSAPDRWAAVKRQPV